LIGGLAEALYSVFLRVQDDEIVNTLKDSEVSQEFIAERIREIIEETMRQEPQLQMML
jgi:hypothetical protein